MTTRNLRIYKFGGASVKTPQAIKNLGNILSKEKGDLIVVISAMGKTTNALENILSGYIAQNASFIQDFLFVKEFHSSIAKELMPLNSQVISELDNIFLLMHKILLQKPHNDYNFLYDQWVSFGEILSTKIISHFLNSNGITCSWVDARSTIRTDNNYREGNIDYSVSKELCQKAYNFKNQNIYITQGFIAGTEDGHTTTLGREGSDYTAALLANLLDAECVTIWKDVDGVLNADPRVFPNTIKLDEVSFKEAIELAYCGAQIIHPKTIKPLQNKQIPLYVRSFVNPRTAGTKVYQTDTRIQYPPILIQKLDQVLISLTPRDFSFVIEDCLSKIFATLYKHRVKANLVQSSAISFSICVDNEEHFLPRALEELNLDFTVRYNNGLELLTVRHFTQEQIDVIVSKRRLLLLQKTRTTFRAVLAKEV